MNSKIKLKKGDLVRVISGKHKGHESPILKIDHNKQRVELEGITKVKHVKPSQNEQEGGIQTIPATIHVSNVALIDPKKKKSITKIGHVIKEDGTKQRTAKLSKAKLS